MAEDSFTFPQSQIGPGTNIANHDPSWSPISTRTFTVGDVGNALTIDTNTSKLKVIQNSLVSSSIRYDYQQPQNMKFFFATSIGAYPITPLKIVLVFTDSIGGSFTIGPESNDSGSYLFEYRDKQRSSITSLSIIFVGITDIPATIAFMDSLYDPTLFNNKCGY